MQSFLRKINYTIVAVLLALVPLKTFAALLEWSITNPSEYAVAGDTINFTGVITNRTGLSLESTDLFINFFNFDFNTLTPNQELGLTSFNLPNLTFSPVIDLFSVDINPFAGVGTYEMDLLLEDISGNFSDTLHITIEVSSQISEPKIMALYTLGLIILLGTIRRQVK